MISSCVQEPANGLYPESVESTQILPISLRSTLILYFHLLFDFPIRLPPLRLPTTNLYVLTLRAFCLFRTAVQ